MIVSNHTAAFDNLRPALAKPGKPAPEVQAQKDASAAQVSSTEPQLPVSADNFTTVDSPIPDVDSANASTELARMSILGQSATAMSAQANVAPQSALRLLQE